MFDSAALGQVIGPFTHLGDARQQSLSHKRAAHLYLYILHRTLIVATQPSWNPGPPWQTQPKRRCETFTSSVGGKGWQETRQAQEQGLVRQRTLSSLLLCISSRSSWRDSSTLDYIRLFEFPPSPICLQSLSALHVGSRSIQFNLHLLIFNLFAAQWWCRCRTELLTAADWSQLGRRIHDPTRPTSTRVQLHLHAHMQMSSAEPRLHGQYVENINKAPIWFLQKESDIIGKSSAFNRDSSQIRK